MYLTSSAHCFSYGFSLEYILHLYQIGKFNIYIRVNFDHVDHDSMVRVFMTLLIKKSYQMILFIIPIFITKDVFHLKPVNASADY